MKRLVTLVAVLFATTLIAQAQVIVYSGHMRGVMFGDNTERVNVQSMLVVDYTTRECSLILYARGTFFPGKWMRTYDLTLNTETLSIFGVAAGESAYFGLDERGRHVIDTYLLRPRDTSGTADLDLAIMLQGRQVPRPVDLGYDGPDAEVAPTLHGLTTINSVAHSDDAVTIGNAVTQYRVALPLTRFYNSDEAFLGDRALVVEDLEQRLDTHHHFED